MKLITISAVTLIMVFTVVFVFSDSEKPKNVAEHLTPLSSDSINAANSLTVQQPTKIAIDELTVVVQHRTTKVDSDKKALWDILEEKKAKPFPFQNPRKIKYHYLRLNRGAISKLKSGDEFSFYVPISKRNYYGIVSQVKLSNSGISSYFGTLINHGRQFTFSITQGPDTTHANFNTPDGHYAIESYAGDAWINDTQDERQSLDYSKTDVINHSTPLLN